MRFDPVATHGARLSSGDTGPAMVGLRRHESVSGRRSRWGRSTSSSGCPSGWGHRWCRFCCGPDRWSPCSRWPWRSGCRRSDARRSGRRSRSGADAGAVAAPAVARRLPADGSGFFLLNTLMTGTLIGWAMASSTTVGHLTREMLAAAVGPVAPWRRGLSAADALTGTGEGEVTLCGTPLIPKCQRGILTFGGAAADGSPSFGDRRPVDLVRQGFAALGPLPGAGPGVMSRSPSNTDADRDLPSHRRRRTGAAWALRLQE